MYGSSTFAFRKTIIALALKHQLPAICIAADWLPDGILMTYGWDLEINSRLAAEFVDKILRGAKAGDIPIQQPTTFRLGINLKTGKALGLTIPPSLLARADQVIDDGPPPLPADLAGRCPCRAGRAGGPREPRADAGRGATSAEWFN